MTSSRGSPPEVFCKKGVLKSFAKFTGRPESRFNKVADSKLLKKPFL